MAEMFVSVDVAAPVARVWAVVCDLEAASDIITAITRVERLDDGEGFGVGTRWRETRTMFGREATEVMEVTTIEPERSYTVEADARGAHYRTIVGIEPHGERTRLSMTFGAEPTGSVSKVMAATIGKLFERSTRKALQQDLTDIAAAAEQGP